MGETAKKEQKKDEVSKALEVLAEDHQRRMGECMTEIQAVLRKYGFDLVVSDPVISLSARPERQ